MNLTIINRALLIPLIFSLITACGGSNDGKKNPVMLPPVTPPDPIPEMILAPSYGDGFTKMESGIHFTVGYKNPTPIPGGQGRAPQHPEHFAGGAAAGDFDNDGDIDVLIVRGDIGPNLLYQNNGQGVFQDVAAAVGIANTKNATENYRHSGPLFVDMNGDGFLDIFLGALVDDPVKVFLNNRNGTFSDVTATSGLSNLTSKHTISAAAGDYDLDGDLDLFLTHWGTPRDIENPDASEHLWRNTSTINKIQFSDVSQASGITTAVLSQPVVGSPLGVDHDATFTPIFADVDNDQYPDLFVTGDFKTGRFLLNNRDGTFRNPRPELPFEDEAGMGSAVADFDNDGDLDWFVSAIGGEFWPLGNRLYENNNLNFTDVSAKAAVNRLRGNVQQRVSWGWGVCAEDFDNDMSLDIYVTNGFSFTYDDTFVSFDFTKDTTLLFMGLGNNTFEEKAKEMKLADTESGRTAICADFDKDGDIDILQIHRNEASAATYYRNDIKQHSWVSVELKNPNSKNHEAIGSKIYLKAGGITQMREVISGSNFTGQNPRQQVFGLNSATVADEIKVVWPDGASTLLTNQTAGQFIAITKE